MKERLLKIPLASKVAVLRGLGPARAEALREAAWEMEQAGRRGDGEALSSWLPEVRVRFLRFRERVEAMGREGSGGGG